MEEILDQISKDIFRTRPELDFFARRIDGCAGDIASFISDKYEARTQCLDIIRPCHRYDALARVLLLYGHFDPGVRYVQGMNELCAPLYHLFATDPLHCIHAEADTFFCFSLLMVDMRDAFIATLDHTDAGMLGRIDYFGQLLRQKDEEVWRHLEMQQVTPVLYTVGWLTLMLAQELEMPEVFRLWDALLSDLARPHPLLQYICVARVMLVRDTLLASDFQDCLKLLQHYPLMSVEDILDSATRLRSADLAPSGLSNRSFQAVDEMHGVALASPAARGRGLR